MNINETTVYKDEIKINKQVPIFCICILYLYFVFVFCIMYLYFVFVFCILYFVFCIFHCFFIFFHIFSFIFFVFSFSKIFCFRFFYTNYFTKFNRLCLEGCDTLHKESSVF